MSTELSFLPEDYLQRKQRQREVVLCSSLLAVVLAAAGGAFWVSNRSVHEVELRESAVDQEYADAARRIEMVKQMREQQRKVVQHAELAVSLLEKVPRSNLLAELTNSLPSGVWLLDFSLDSRPHEEAAPPAGATAFDQKKAALDAKAKAGDGPRPQRYDVHMKLTGVAGTDVQVAQFIAKLNQSKLLRDVNLLISEVYQEHHETLRRFQIEMMLDPDAEVRDDPTLAAKTSDSSVVSSQ